MIIECTSCHARYQYDEDRFERKPSKKIKCAKCATVFEIHNPAFSAKKAVTAENDTTASRHDATSVTKPKPKVEDTTAQSPLPQPDTDKLPPAAELPKGKRLSLAIIDGSDAGNVFRINKPRVTIGRSNADFVINDTEASRQHAAIEVRDMTYLVSDLGSTNGTLVDGKKITEPVELQDKSEFVIGTTTLMLIVTDEA
ncbi:MAG TPA: FHA domain-containing protein [Thermoanaerobaculia bacterium]|nr:FHA domain-containing protein [Thermoanaerobaculia bacterium]